MEVTAHLKETLRTAPLGSMWELGDGATVVVEEAREVTYIGHTPCCRCHFYHRGEPCRLTGACMSRYREDRVSVSFNEVKEAGV